MTNWPWEKLAIAGAEMPDGLSLEDQLAYLSMRIIYRDFRAGVTDKTKAAAEKRKIFMEWRKRTEAREAADRMTDQHIRLWREGELAREKYRKERSLEAADMMLRVMEGVTP